MPIGKTERVAHEAIGYYAGSMVQVTCLQGCEATHYELRTGN